VHAQGADVGRGKPRGRAGLNPVRPRREVVCIDATSVEADRELLKGALHRVDDDVRGVAVDPGDVGGFDP
jgi:hypothetical protein